MSAPATATTHPPRTGGTPDLASLKRGMRLGAFLLLAVGGIIFLGSILHPLEWFQSSPYPPQNVVYGATTATSPTPASACDYAHRKLVLGSEPVVFNPGAACAYNFTVAEGAIEFDGPDGSVVVEANEPVQQHMFVETARAVNGHAVLKYQLYPMGANHG